MRPITAACFFAFSTALTAPLPALAQQTISGQSAQAAQVTRLESSWIQIEAHSTLLGAQDRIRDYGQTVPNLAGFDLGSGWYGILLGPYTADETCAAPIAPPRVGAPRQFCTILISPSAAVFPDRRAIFRDCARDSGRHRAGNGANPNTGASNKADT